MLARIGFVLAILAGIVIVRLISRKAGVPFAILLTLAGLVYAVLPGPNLHLDPHVVLSLVLPPLLYSAARSSSLVAIRANLRPIVSLSVLLVLATAFAVGALVVLVVPGMPLSAGIVLGAAVAPPDPVATLAVARRARLPARMSTLIEGEGLLNDATALTTYQVAVAATVGGGFSLAVASGRFLVSAAGGLVIGAAVAIVVRLISRLVREDPMLTITLSLATPFAAYAAGEAIHVSGVLAVVVSALMVGHEAPRRESGASRLQGYAVWQLVEFLLEGFVFLLIGQQLPEVLRGLRGESVGTVAAAAGVTVAAVVLIRPLWLCLTQLFPASSHARLGAAAGQRLSLREVVALSWAGSRGVISLAAIFAVPLTVDGGAEFPARDLLLFCTYIVVLVTLVGQGLTFAPILRKLGLRSDASDEAQLRNEARLAALGAARSAVEDLLDSKEITQETADALLATLAARGQRYEARIAMLQDSDDGEVNWTPEYAAAVAARRTLIAAQHDELLRWRDSGRLPDASLRRLQRELDHEERTLPDQ